MQSFSARSFWNRIVTGILGTPLTRGRRAASRGRQTRAAALWLEGARAGDADCQLSLAEALWQGTGVLRDPRSAMRWYEQAADAGLATAQARLAGLHAIGIGDAADQQRAEQPDESRLVVPRDRAKARLWATKAAEQEHMEAQVLLGWLLSLEEEGRDISLAIDWYSRAAEKGSAPAMVGLAGLISAGEVPGQGPEDAYELYRRAAVLNNKTAFYYLGVSLQQGVGVAPDPAEACKWLLRAAEEGVAGAMRSLGLIHLRGLGGVPVDMGQAETWFRRAAIKGDTESMALLADLHSSGKANVPNQAEAIVWYVAASDKGHAPARTALGLAHLAGKGVVRDPTRAVDFFERAADEHPEARFQLALCHLHGRGVAVNAELAAQHMLKAAAQKHPDATYNYGALLYHGNGVAQDRHAALCFYGAAADLGSASGQFRMAHAHTLGREVPEDPVRAIDLFTAAAEQDHVAAQVNLARMLLKHRPDDRAALEKWRERLRLQAMAGVTEAITILAELQWRMDRDADGAMALVRQAMAKGDPMAQYVKDMIGDPALVTKVALPAPENAKA
ncbi:tetratricopeptide repeat protein [Niveispirillum sp. KHB5.9]|uniref:tetratricopeptide repeat protein n=1 Tax=Niveispirillum sp. KHB5.9 TaxID=3400269 RepID=UPI003A8C6A3E